MYKKLTPYQSVLKAYLRESPEEQDITAFRKAMQDLLDNINPDEREEFNKNLVAKFFNESLYKDYLINTCNNTDLAIYSKTNNSNKSPLVLFEFKGPNRPDMVTKENLKQKSLYELILYYIREEVEKDNKEITHLVITNCWEYFIFEKKVFYQLFASNKRLVKSILAVGNGNDKTDYIYNEIIKPYVEQIEEKLQFTYLDLKQFAKEIKNDDIIRNKQFIAAYKLLSPTHLLRLPFKSDHNTLNDNFYKELLYIMGVEEVAENKIHKIKRLKADKQSYSLIEQAYLELEEYFPYDGDERFETALGLVLTWINRILFLKLLESQLQNFNSGADGIKFMDTQHINDYDALHDLFMKVLAKPIDERLPEMTRQFPNVPYLNSSLFERSELEQKYLTLHDIRLGQIDVFGKTILKDEKGRRIKGKMSSLEYLLSFLDAYDFGSEHNTAAPDVHKTSKTLINASVLGLVFEKINGYKDGSFYTPGYVTQYICRETIRKAVVDKFNAIENWECADFDELREKIEYTKPEVRNKANEIVNSLKICDPAVGSGHFLVSALNELVAIKYELGILQDRRKQERIREYEICVESDELVMFDGNGDNFKYNYHDVSSQRIQEALFEEKRTIIENCLFGVDINPKSVEICRLRLWIELLKNAYYYRNEKGRLQLQTLPNIDINIKSGNSLIHRFDLKESISQVLKSTGITIAEYKNAVAEYKNAHNKAEKHHLEELIEKIKSTLTTNLDQNNPKRKKLRKLKKELANSQALEFYASSEWTAKQLSEKRKKEERISEEIKKLEDYISEIESNKAYIGAFEWRIEFPEILNNEGDFLGFDCVIGNPPYGVSVTGRYRETIIDTLGKVPDYEIYYYFIQIASCLLQDYGVLAYIIPNTYLFNTYAKKYREEILMHWEIIDILDCTKFPIFESATVRNTINIWKKNESNNNLIGYRNTANSISFSTLITRPKEYIEKKDLLKLNQNWGLAFCLSPITIQIVNKIVMSPFYIKDLFDVSQGYIPYRKSDLIKTYGKEQGEKIVKQRLWHSPKPIDETYLQEIYGRDINKYAYHSTGEYVKYGKHLACFVDLRFFSSDRILVREITSPSIIACYVSELFVNDPQLISIIKRDNASSLFVLWAILNSKLATFYHFNHSPKATKGAFPKILVQDIKDFPLPDIPNENKVIIENLVDKIIKLKRNNPQADTKDYEKEIDKLVYHLYGLTYDEILIVDPETPITREEYELN